MTRHTVVVWFLGVVSFGSMRAQGTGGDPLEYRFSGGYGQVEVGGRYAGAEFHDSRPLPSRISFYYPVANSVDVSTDYWKRGDSRPMAAGVRIDGGAARWLGRGPWEYVLSPHRVTFFHAEGGLAFTMRYEFGFLEPFMVYRLTIRNTDAVPKKVEAYVHLKASLRTCQTYDRFDSAMVSYDSTLTASFAHFDQPQTDTACVVVRSVGDTPSGWTTDAGRIAATDSGTSAWADGLPRPAGRVTVEARRQPAVTAYTYSRTLQPGDSLSAVLLIGSCKSNEARSRAGAWGTSWDEDVGAYDAFIRRSAGDGAHIRTGDPWVDRSVLWANALLAANAHYLDGVVVPMPCPAEYNFFFTHDMLLTDLAAVAFDPHRVQRDLKYLVSHSRDSVIPHAYYWRDDGFKTEYCTPDNWNHLWFILATGIYLRHTVDSTLGRELYPLVTKSMREALLRLHPDHLMHANAPDWWDIGKHEGPRAYMTILIIRAIREYLFISSFLREDSRDLLKYERIADDAQRALGDRLWDEKTRYLMNVNGSLPDPHLYMGSLLAPVFGVLDSTRSRQLVETAGRELLAPGVGVRTVMPPDFHTDSIRAFFQFAGNEAGDPYLYANGGVWPHNNAWYTLALRATGRVDDAYKFYRETMTLDGIAHSPMGQPAMYEYRFSDPHSTRYGAIDKPSFLWAAGFSLLTAYRLAGIIENPWNVSFSQSLPSLLDSVNFAVEFNGRKAIVRNGGAGEGLMFAADGASVPSVVVPLNLGATTSWVLRNGHLAGPRLESINAIVHAATVDPKSNTLRITTSSFAGHAVTATLSAGSRPKAVMIDGKRLTESVVHPGPNGRYVISVRFTGASSVQIIDLTF